MADIDPLTRHIDQLQNSLARSATPTESADVASVEVGPDGSLRAIHLTDAGRRLDPDVLVTEIVRLHAEALAESRKAIAAAIAQIENDPRLQALTERSTDALNQPLPRQQAPAASAEPTRQPPAESSTTAWSQPRLPPDPTAPAESRQRAATWEVAPASATPRATSPAPPMWPNPQTPARSAEPVKSREPTQEEEEEMDRYYQRKSWLEY